MRLVRFKGSQIYIQLNVLTSFFYKQQFQSDFYRDLVTFKAYKKGAIGMRLVWALSKSNDFDVLDYDQWLSLFENGDTDWESIQIELDKIFLEVEKSNKPSNKRPSKYAEEELLINANRMGLSMDLLKIMLPSELSNGLSQTEKKEATQKDIDSFLM